MRKRWLFAVLIWTLANAQAQNRVTFARDFAPSESWTKPVEQPYRADICLNGSWQFQPMSVSPNWKRDSGIAPELSLPTANGWETTPIKIPSPWNINTWGPGRNVGAGTEHPYWPSSVYYPSYPARWDGVEMGWLRRTFRVPQTWTNRRLILHFEAVAGDAQIFVNGQKAGAHFGSHLPFEINVTDFVKPNADNELSVGVRGVHLFDEVSERYPKMRSPYPPGSTTDNLRGIWQDVFLLGLPPLRVADVFVKPLVDSDTLEAEITLQNDSAREQSVSLSSAVQPWVNLAGTSVLDAPESKWRLDPAVMNLASQRVSLKPGASVVVTVSEKVNGRLKFWSPEAPNLYGLVLSVNDGNTTLDRSYTRFGWRQVKIVGPDVLLNGNKIKMSGDLLHPFGPFVNSRRYVWAWYRMIKDMHGNAVRPHAQPHPRAYLDLADEMGIMVLDETALFGSSVKLNFEAPSAWDNFADHYDHLILRDRNHPSVFGWSFGNELFAIFRLNNVGKEQSDEWYRKLADLGNRARRLDPTRDWLSCDGDEDLRGALPVWNRHFGHGLPNVNELPQNLNKPLMIGESGGSYYARPGQLAVFNGERAYENYAGRNEALGIDVYDNIVNLALPKLAFYSPAETAWFGLEHLNFGYRDFTRLPKDSDGVWFKPFEEGKPGVQPERLPPYVATLNPGWDATLPLYKPLAMFEAQKAAQAKNDPQPGAWEHKTAVPKTVAPAVPVTIENVNFAGAADGELARRLKMLGVPLAETPSKMLIVDAETLNEAMLSQVKQSADATLAAGGAVWVMFGKSAAPLINQLLPAPVALTPREATALVPRVGDAAVAGLGLPDLYFAEDATDKYILKRGFDGELVRRGHVLLQASNTDWSLFNDVREDAKCAAVVLYESLIKPNGAALVEMPSGNGRVLVSSLEMTPTSQANAALWRRLFANAGVRLGAVVSAKEQANQAFNAQGVLIRSLALGLLPAEVPEKAVETDLIRVKAAPKVGEMALGAKWKPFVALGEDRYNFSQFNAAPPEAGQGVVAYFSFWINSPLELSDVLLAGPDAPKVGLRCYVADEMKLLVNGEVVAPGQAEPADYRKLISFERLPLKKGWNQLLIKVAGAQSNGPNQGTLAASLFCDQPQFLEQLQSAVTN